MIGKIKKGFSLLLSLIISLISGGIIWYFWKPIAAWYWNYRPLLGVDFYNFASYVSFFDRHFVWPFNGWKYIWWSGGPIYYDYPTLHMYLTLPLLNYFSLPQAIQIYMLGAAFLFLFFSYLLFYELARERILPLVLTIASSFSIGLYGALVWGGSLPYFATQLFLPLVLWLLVRFLKYESKGSLLLAGLFLGMSLLGHSQVAFSYILPITILLFLAFSLRSGKKLILPRIKLALTFFGSAFLVGFPSLYLFVGITPQSILITIPDTIGRILGRVVNRIPNPNAPIGTPAPLAGSYSPADYNRDQLVRFWNDINPLFFYLLAVSIIIFLVAFLLRQKKASSLNIIFYTLPLAWVVFYISLYGFSIPLMHGGWYRVFWPFPLVLGVLISFIWGDFWEVISEKLKNLKWRFMVTIVVKSVFGILILLGSFVVLSQNSAELTLKNIESPLYRQQSSAFPDSLSVEIDQDKFGGLKKKLIPSWLDPNDTQYRFYDADQRVNIWWNTFYDMPLVKGYIEFPPGDSAMGSYYWLSTGLTASGGSTDVLVKQWGVPEETAYNNVLFLLDWFSIKYLEAEHERSDSYNPFTSYIRDSDIFLEKEKVIIPGWAELYTGAYHSGVPITWHPEAETFLSYYKVKDELVSPIISSTDASTLGIIGRHDAYSTIIRNLGALNLNSKYLIPLWFGQFIDNISYEDMKVADALFLYTYDYKNFSGSWNKIEKYVKEGGKVFIETGSDVKQTAGNTPTLFPFEKTKKEQIGSEWRLSGSTPETEGINLEEFGPPILDGEPWFFSIPDKHDGLKEGTSVILADNGTPIVISQPYGKGKIVWSGMNLPYHLNTYKSLEELKFYKNILDGIVDTNITESPGFTANRNSSNQVTIKSQKAKGVIFKENMSPGWQAKLASSSVNKDLKIYKTGITYNGYAYVRLPEGVKDSFTVTFSYPGYFWSYFWSAVSFLTILLILDKVLLGGRLLIPILAKIIVPLRMKVGSLWGKEDEY